MTNGRCLSAPGRAHSRGYRRHEYRPVRRDRQHRQLIAACAAAPGRELRVGLDRRNFDASRDPYVSARGTLRKGPTGYGASRGQYSCASSHGGSLCCCSWAPGWSAGLCTGAVGAAAAASPAPSAGSYTPLASPTRVCDTRAGNPSKLTGDASQCLATGKGTIQAGKSLDVAVAGHFNVPSAGECNERRRT